MLAARKRGLDFTRSRAKNAMTAVIATNAPVISAATEYTVIVPKNDKKSDGHHEHRQCAKK